MGWDAMRCDVMGCDGTGQDEMGQDGMRWDGDLATSSAPKPRPWSTCFTLLQAAVYGHTTGSFPESETSSWPVLHWTIAAFAPALTAWESVNVVPDYLE